MAENLFKTFIIAVIIGVFLVMGSGRTAEGIRAFFKSIVQNVRKTPSREMTNDTIDKFQAQVELLKERYRALEDQQKNYETHASALETQFEDIHNRRRDETASLMSHFLERRADQIADVQNSREIKVEKNVITRVTREQYEVTSSEIQSDLRQSTRRLVHEYRSDLRRLMELYEMLEQQRRMMMETLEMNLEMARERAKQTDSQVQVQSEKIMESTKQNLRTLLEKLEEREIRQQALLSNRRTVTTNLEEITQKIQDKINDLDRSRVNSWRMPDQDKGDIYHKVHELMLLGDKQKISVESLSSIRLQLIDNARDGVATRQSFEQTLVSAETQTDEGLSRIQENITTLDEQQAQLLDQLKESTVRFREENQQNLMNIHEWIAQIAQANREGKELLMEKVNDMREKQRTAQQDMRDKLQNIREKAREQRYDHH